MYLRDMPVKYVAVSIEDSAEAQRFILKHNEDQYRRAGNPHDKPLPNLRLHVDSSFLEPVLSEQKFAAILGSRPPVIEDVPTTRSGKNVAGLEAKLEELKKLLLAAELDVYRAQKIGEQEKAG